MPVLRVFCCECYQNNTLRQWKAAEPLKVQGEALTLELG